MCPHGYHHSGSMATPALGTQDVRLSAHMNNFTPHAPYFLYFSVYFGWTFMELDY